MSAGYALLMSDTITTLEAAEVLGVSLDTVRGMIRDGVLPATRSRRGGPYVLDRRTVEAARDARVASLRSGPVRLTEADRARLRKVREVEELASAGVEKARAARAARVVALGHQQRGTGAMAAALRVDRSVVQDILREAGVPVVHHRRATELTGAEKLHLMTAQAAIAQAVDAQNAARDAREALTRKLLAGGGYGVATEVAHELGRHRSRLLSHPKRRRQG
jgi:excisionase family DNA binding protein